MDLQLLEYAQQISSPALDALMVAATYAGLGLLPFAGAALWVSGQRRLGAAVLTAILAGITLTVAFQFLAMRPRPPVEFALIPTPAFPSFPSGHAAIAFSVAVLIGLHLRDLRAWALGLTGASVIAFSRVYLGVHYPSDLIGGAILGAAAGAGVYGLSDPSASGLGKLRWLLWLQLAVALLVTMMAYLDHLPGHLLSWRFADKVFHFLLVGSVAFWLGLWRSGSSARIGRLRIPTPLIVYLALVIAEEALQALSPVRAADLGDLTANLLGIAFFFALSTRIRDD